MHLVIGDIAERGITVTPSVKCEEVYSIFINDSSLEGIVVLQRTTFGASDENAFFSKTVH